MSILINKYNPVYKEMVGVINQHAKIINKEWTVQQSVVIRSLDNCAEQNKQNTRTALILK
jgi:hypothetical protein